MANEVLYSGLGNARLSSILHQELQVALTDQAHLWNHPAIRYLGDLRGRGSTAVDVPFANLGGASRMAAVAENASSSNTDVTDTKATITIARQALQRQISDLAELTDSAGLNVAALAQDMVASAAMRFTEMILDVTDGFSSTVGTTTVDLDVDDFFDAQFTLTQASVPGPYVWCPYPVQLTDLQNSLRAESGALQFMPATADMLAIKGQGYSGSLNGVDIFASSLVPTANAAADSASGMWGLGAVGYADGTTAPVTGAGGIVLPAGTKIMVEFERDAAGALTKIVGNYYVGCAILEDSRGVSVITDR